MANNKKQHYVPQFYLRRFSNDKKSINIWNISREHRIEHAKLKNQCYKNYFYGQENNLEEALSSVEAKAAQILREITGNDAALPLPLVDHFNLIVYVLLQYGRTLHSADTTNEAMDDLAKYVLQGSEAENNIDLSKIQIGLKNAPSFSLGIVASGYPYLLDLDYKLLVNKTRIEFVTSDNPVVLYNQLLSYRKFVSNTGLCTKGLQVFLPVDPHHVLLFYDRDVYTVGNKKTMIVEVRRSRDVVHLNGLQVCAALNNVYFRNPDLDIESLYSEFSKCRSDKKSNFGVSSIEDEITTESGELVHLYRQDVGTNLCLTFAQTKFSARRWRCKFRRLREQPVVVIRNDRWTSTCDAFHEAVSRDEFAPSEFFKFLQETGNMS